MKIETDRFCDQLKNRRLSQHPPPPRLVRTADNDMTHAVVAAKFKKRLHRFFGSEPHDFGAQVARSLFIVKKIALQCSIDAMAGLAFGFYVDDKPVGI